MSVENSHPDVGTRGLVDGAIPRGGILVPAQTQIFIHRLDHHSEVAMKRRSPAHVLALLTVDADESVRLRVALNPRVTVEVLRMLMDDPWKEVRRVARTRI